MNVFLLMSGGVGNRFGANIPKQYVKLNDRPVIEYVLEAALAARNVDKIVVVMDRQYKDISKLLNNEKIIITNNGSDRYSSLKNGLECINNNFNCENVLIADAVAPFIYPELIDDYFNKMDEYDIVLTGQKITGALCDFEGSKYDREDFFMAQAPEVFKFKMLYDNIDYNTKYQAISCLMPKNTKRYVNFNFKNNLKLTYNFELKYAEFLMNYQNNEKDFDNVSSSAFFETKGIKNYLLRIKNKETRKWLDNVYLYYKSLENKYGKFKNITLNQSSNNGIVMLIDSNNSEFVLKIIPSFLNRYKNEKEAYKLFSNEFMCELIDFDDQNNALFLRKLETIDNKIFDENIKLTDFFNRVFKNSIKYDETKHNFFVKIIDSLKIKKNNINDLEYLKEELDIVLSKAINIYNDKFNDNNLYVIHGDLREENILKYNDRFIAIDPIGYIAPIEMEASRFIIGDIFNNRGYDSIDRIKMLINYFSKWCNKERLLYGLYIFLSMITYNSVLENESNVNTLYYLEILNRIENEMM